MATSKSLKTAVAKETKTAEKRASTGDVETKAQAPNPSDVPAPDLPTGARSRR